MGGKISVIVPVYNVEKYLPKCIESIRNQTHHNLEILLVNDGSTDRSGIICEKYAALDPRIETIHKENGGLSDARNTGIEAATGDYIAFVDSDDWIDEDMYELLYGLLCEHEAEVAICRIREFSDMGIIEVNTNDIVVCTGKKALVLIVTRDNKYKLDHGITNKLIKKELIQNFRFPVGKLIEDIYFTPPLIYASQKCVYIDTAKYNYLTDRQGSIMNSDISEKLILDELNGHQQLERFLLSKRIQECLPQVNEFFLNRILYFHYEVKNSAIENKETLLKTLEELFNAKFNKSTKRQMSLKNRWQISLFEKSPGFYNQLQGSVRKVKAVRNKLKSNKGVLL